MKTPGGSCTSLATLRLRLRDERAEVAAAHIGLDDDAPLAVLAADLVEAFRELEAGELRAAAPSAAAARRSSGSITGRAPTASRSSRVALSQPDDDVEAPVAFEHEPGLAPAQRGGDGVGHVLDRQAVAGDGVAVELHVERREAGGLLDPHVGRALRPCRMTAAIRGRDALELVEIVADRP